MRVVDRKSAQYDNMGNTRTIEHFNTKFGDKPHKAGLVATMYPDLAITSLTDALRNVFYNPKTSGSDFTPINAMAIQWDIKVNFIHKVIIAESVTIPTPGLNKTPFTLYLESKYYDKNDTFTLA